MKENNKVLKCIKFFKYFSLVLLLICVFLIAYCLLTSSKAFYTERYPYPDSNKIIYWDISMYHVQKEILFYSCYLSLFFSCFQVIVLFIQLFYTKYLRKKALNEHGRYRK